MSERKRRKASDQCRQQDRLKGAIPYPTPKERTNPMTPKVRRSFEALITKEKYDSFYKKSEFFSISGKRLFNGSKVAFPIGKTDKIIRITIEELD